MFLACQFLHLMLCRFSGISPGWRSRVWRTAFTIPLKNRQRMYGLRKDFSGSPFYSSSVPANPAVRTAAGVGPGS